MAKKKEETDHVVPSPRFSTGDWRKRKSFHEGKKRTSFSPSLSTTGSRREGGKLLLGLDKKKEMS